MEMGSHPPAGEEASCPVPAPVPVAYTESRRCVRRRVMQFATVLSEITVLAIVVALLTVPSPDDASGFRRILRTVRHGLKDVTSWRPALPDWGGGRGHPSLPIASHLTNIVARATGMPAGNGEDPQAIDAPPPAQEAAMALRTSAAWTGITVTAIICGRGGASCARINNRLLQTGDTINGLRILAITSHSVTLARGTERYEFLLDAGR